MVRLTPLFVLIAFLLAAPVSASTAEGDTLLARSGRALDRGDADTAEALLRDAAASVDDGRVERGLALVALLRDDPDEAIKQARNAIKRDRRNAEFHLVLAYAYGTKASRGGVQAMFYAGKYKSACEDAVRLDPDSVDARMAVLQYYLMAPGFAGGGEGKAEETIRTIESLDPVYGHIARGLAAWIAEDPDEAERQYVAATRADTSSVDAWGALGVFYMAEERYTDAVPVGERILALEPHNLEAVYALAKAHLLAGDDLDAAEGGFRLYIEEGGAPRGATEAEARWRLGMALDASGRPGEARAEWVRALELDPELERAAARLDSLDAAHPELR